MQRRVFPHSTQRYTNIPDELERQTFGQRIESHLIMTYYQPANVLLIVSLSSEQIASSQASDKG
jgi:hypothetical protein